ncbi:hypothetical protein AJ80_02442 [Polytolypa hystricis UAMH7299]|uniref:Uncharacterized protein n=1 Tax=Polytolypa hystricis (strain UAMH7299) TaxID=1447883 RepID=A0A2B7YRI4_POLH7|nr:hypothetical protein AJ80_02442 [Polytolypa hystricis UAMH7299]
MYLPSNFHHRFRFAEASPASFTKVLLPCSELSSVRRVLSHQPDFTMRKFEDRYRRNKRYRRVNECGDDLQNVVRK